MGEGSFQLPLCCPRAGGFVLFICFLSEWYCSNLGFYPKGDRGAWRSSFHFTDNTLHPHSAFPWASEGSNSLMVRCLADRLPVLFCTAESFQVIAALVNLSALIHPRPLSLCLLFFVSFFCGWEEEWEPGINSVSPYMWTFSPFSDNFWGIGITVINWLIPMMVNTDLKNNVHDC